VWPPIVTVGWAAGFVRSWQIRVFTVAAGLAFVWFSQPGQANLESRWSPYYLVQYQVTAYGTQVFVNSGFHQLGYNFAVANREIPEKIAPVVTKWGVPYQLYRDEHGGRSPRSVLVLGAGTGNDVAIALQNGAERVVAVEVDPVILELGRTTNARKTYADPRVECHVTDARQFLRSTTASFDLIVFGTLDSQALLSSQGNLRLDNYVYTRESLEDARRALADRGFVAVFYSVQKPWLYERLYSTFRGAFGDQSRIYEFENAFLFNTLIVGTKGSARFSDIDDHITRYSHGRIATDDWPFVYLEHPTIGDPYRNFIGVVLGLVFAAFLVLRVLERGAIRHTPFFFLGAGFTLMEAVAIVRLALLFGSTWIVNVVVFVAVLLTVFIANLSVMYRVAPPLRASWVCLCAALAASYLLPVQFLLEFALPLRIVASTGLIFVPVYFASVCFSRLFQREEEVGFPLGLNLVGAMAGGWLEYLSMVFGLRAIWLVAVLVYALAWLFAEWSRGFKRSATA
jgi:SAM-dependent methyltransferase